jgi:hypothetical protein
MRFTIALWTAQIVLAVIFAAAGAFKAFTARETLLAKAPDLRALPFPLVRFIGIAELAASAAFILPPLTRIAPMLTPIAAVSVLPILTGAFVVNLRARHWPSLLLVAVCAALACFVALQLFAGPRTTPAKTEPISASMWSTR